MFKKLFSKSKTELCSQDTSDLMKNTKAHIQEHGLSVIRVLATGYNPGFAYSVGLFETYQHPEIICFGLKPDVLHEIINDVAKIIHNKGAINSTKE